MESIVQALIVAVIVLASVLAAVWRLMPARTRLRVLDAFKPSDGNAFGRWLLGRRERVLSELAHGCNTCSHAPSHVQKHAAPKRP